MTSAGQAHLAMLAFSGLVAGSFALGARAAPHVDPVALTAARFLLAAAALAVLARRLDLSWRSAVLGGLMGTYFVLMFEGLKTAHSVSAAAVFTLLPAMTALVAIPILGQRPGPGMAAALALGAFGALWVIFRGDPAALAALDVGRGEAIYAAGCLAHAVYTPMVRRLDRNGPPVATTAGTMLAGALLLGLLGAPRIAATDWPALPPVVWVTLVYTAIAASAASLLLLNFAALRLPAAQVMAYTYLVPAWVLGWEAALGGAWPAPWTLAGAVFTLAALGLLFASPATRPASPGK